MRKWVETISKVIQQRLCNDEGAKEFGSPVAVFRQSPVSTPVTSGYQAAPRTEEGVAGSYMEDPIKVSVILPQVKSFI